MRSLKMDVEKKRILYFHGFASSPRSKKITPLRERLPEAEFVVPDMNVPSFGKLDWPSMVAEAVRLSEEIKPRLIVGSSLGSLLALEVVHAGIRAPIVMISPALGVARRWTEVLPDDDPVLVHNYVTDRKEPIHRRFFEQMATLEIDRDPPPVPVTALMGRNDESVPFDIAFETWTRWQSSGELPRGSKFVEIPEGDHSLVDHVDRIAEEIRLRLRAASGG